MDAILSKLEEYFKPKRNVIYERYIFHTTQQEPNETISEYVTKLRRLAASCDFGTLKEDMIRDRIVIGTSDEEVRPHLLRNPSLNLNTCIEMCQSSELARMQLQKIAPVQRHPMAEENVHWTSTKKRQTNGKDGDQCQYCGGGKHMSKKNVQHGEKPVENVKRGIILPECVDLQVRKGRIPDGRNLGGKELQTREQSMWFMVKIQMVQTVEMIILMSLSM